MSKGWGGGGGGEWKAKLLEDRFFKKAPVGAVVIEPVGQNSHLQLKIEWAHVAVFYHESWYLLVFFMLYGKMCIVVLQITCN